MSIKERILIVDDRRSEVWFIERILQREDFEVLTAFDGPEGLQKAGEEKPDLIILDTIMPRMDGYKVYRHLQKDPDTTRIPVLFLTNNGKVDEKRIIAKGGHSPAIGLNGQGRGHQAVALDCLTKPVTSKEVVDKVQALLQVSKLRVRSEEESCILIVDDNRSTVRLAERVLQKEGYDVITAFDGLEGLRKVREEKPDLIILDIIMPELNGFQVLDLVRQHTKAPVIMLTSEHDIDSVKSTLALGADDYVVKPFSIRDLLDRVREKLGRTTLGVP